MSAPVEVLPPLADGSWWLVQCHRCREIVGEAVASVTRSSAGGDGATAILLDPPYATSGDLRRR